MTLILGLAVGAIVEIESGDKFCLTDLEKDHSVEKFKVKVYSAFYGDAGKINVVVNRDDPAIFSS